MPLKQRGRPVTQKMIAEELGLHFTTVSAALRGAPDIPERTRERVIQTAKEMGYVPNEMARSLRSSKNHLVGMIGDLEFSQNIARRISSTAKHLHDDGYELMFFHTPTRGESIDAILRSLTAHRISTVLVGGALPTVMPSDFANWLKKNDKNVFMMPWLPFTKNVIDIDREQEVCMAVDYLTSLGHRHIAIAFWPEENWELPIQSARLKGWYRACQEHDLGDPDQWVLSFMQEDEEPNLRMIRQMLVMQPRPTALICSSDLNAMLSIRHLNRLGIRVPEDISVIGRDGSSAARFSVLPLTTLAHPIAELARQTARKLIEMIENRCDSEFEPILVPPTLEIRDSTGTAPDM